MFPSDSPITIARFVTEMPANLVMRQKPLAPHKSALHPRLRGGALWSGAYKNRDVSTGPLARPLAPLTRLLAHDCSLCLRPPLRSLCSLPRSWESEFLMSQNDLVLSHSAALDCGWRRTLYLVSQYCDQWIFQIPLTFVLGKVEERDDHYF